MEKKNKRKLSAVRKRKETAYLKMREETGMKNKHSLIELMNSAYCVNDIGQVITAGGDIYGE